LGTSRTFRQLVLTQSGVTQKLNRDLGTPDGVRWITTINNRRARDRSRRGRTRQSARNTSWCARDRSRVSEALHQEQLDTKRERRQSTEGRAIRRELARQRQIARYEVRDTISNRKARNLSRLGSTVGGYQVIIHTLRQLVLERSGVTGLELDNQRRRKEAQSVVTW
jgi:hypothetical protein